jgi:hypothetical protein
MKNLWIIELVGKDATFKECRLRILLKGDSLDEAMNEYNRLKKEDNFLKDFVNFHALNKPIRLEGTNILWLYE